MMWLKQAAEKKLQGEWLSRSFSLFLYHKAGEDILCRWVCCAGQGRDHPLSDQPMKDIFAVWIFTTYTIK